MITLVIVKNPFSPKDGREIQYIEASGTLASLKEEYAMPGVDLMATINGYSVEDDTVIKDGDFIVIYPAIEKGGGGKGKSILGLVAAIALSVVSFGVGGIASGLGWGASMASWTAAGYLAAAAVMFLGSSLIGRMTGQKTDTGSYGGENEATYAWSGVQTMEGQNNPVALTYGVVKSGGQTIAKYTMANGKDDYLYWLVSAGEGELQITDIKLNNNAIGLYRDVSYQVRAGTNDQSIIPYFGDTHYTLPLSYNMEDLNTWYSAQAQGTATQGLIIKIECPNGLLHTTNEGKTVENWVAVQIEVKKGSGAWMSYNSFALADLTDWDSSKNALVVRGSSTKAVRKEYRIDRLPADEYTVRVRVTQRGYSNSQRDMFATYWTGVSSVIYDDFSYPCTALIGIKAKASGQLSGSPSLTFVKVRGTIYAYNPTARAYQQKSANNPAWACYDLLHQCRYLKNVRTGSYQYEVRGVPKELMRYDDFAAWAAYCDSKHFNVNIEIVTAGEMLDVANEKIAPIGHGRVVRFGTRYGCIYSHPQQAVQMFGMGNIITGTFKEEFLKVADRANCVEVTYTNADADYARDVITIYSDTYNSDGYAKPAQVTMDGITKMSQAYREGVYHLLCNKLQLRTVTFEAGIDSIACTVGDVIVVSHDVPQWQCSGRVESVNGNTVVLPCEVGDLGATYVLQWRRSSTDVLYEKNCTIVSSADGWTTATISGASVGTTISAGDIFSLAESGTEDKLFTVQSITRAQDFTRMLTCIEYNEDVFEEPSNYDPDESREVLYSVMFGQMANEVITVTARRGIKAETYTSSFTKQEGGWYLDVSINATTAEYAVGEIVINGTNYGSFGVRNLPLNKDYFITALPALVGCTVYLNGNLGTAWWGNLYYQLYHDAGGTEVADRGELQGKVRVVDISDGMPTWGGGIFGHANSQNMGYVALRKATVIDQNVDVASKTTLVCAVNDCLLLTTIDLSNWNPISTTSVASMFSNDAVLRDIGDISNWTMPELLDASGMFSGCSALVSIDFHDWSTPKLTNVGAMFDGCSVMKCVDISGINTTNITNADNMFNNCSSMDYVIMDSNEIKFSGDVVMPTPNANCKYLVPANMVNAYKSHANWSSRASKIDSISNYTIVRSNGHVTVAGG